MYYGMTNTIGTSRHLPQDYDQLKIVHSMGDILSSEFNNIVSIFILPRNLTDDFNGLATKMASVINLPERMHLEYSYTDTYNIFKELWPYLSSSEQDALNIIIQDFTSLINADPRLLIEGKSWKAETQHWHYDGIYGKEYPRWICGYNVRGTQFLKTNDAIFFDFQAQAGEEGGGIITMENHEIFQTSPGDFLNYLWVSSESKTDMFFIHRRDPDILSTGQTRISMLTRG